MTHYYDLRKQPAKVTRSWLKADFGFNPTRAWRISYGLNYDIEGRKLTAQNLSVYRDLHCWEARFSWHPTGFNSGFYFKINIKGISSDQAGAPSGRIRGLAGREAFPQPDKPCEDVPNRINIRHLVQIPFGRIAARSGQLAGTCSEGQSICRERRGDGIGPDREGLLILLGVHSGDTGDDVRFLGRQMCPSPDFRRRAGKDESLSSGRRRRGPGRLSVHALRRYEEGKKAELREGRRSGRWPKGTTNLLSKTFGVWTFR